jgi:hypothetical protein
MLKVLKFQASAAGGIGECFHAAVIPAIAAIEYDCLDAGIDGPLAEHGPNRCRSTGICSEFLCGAFLGQCGEEHQRSLGVVIDALRVDVFR